MFKYLLVARFLLELIQCEQFSSLKMFNSDVIEGEDRYCFSYNEPDTDDSKFMIKKHRLSHYCLRIHPKEYLDEQMIQTNPSLSFDDLKNQHITVEQLFQWSNSIDIIERYQMYLLNITSKFEERFFNCTQRRFGSRCQYRFYHSGENIADLLSLALRSPYYWVDEDSSEEMAMKNAYLSLPESCYTGLNCRYKYPYPMCLDWREICDGKIDCLNNGIDEEHCSILELTQCSEHESRCHNGAHCIPSQFWHDDDVIPDCLDQSDEVYDYYDECYTMGSISCEEHICRNDLDGIACGDGQCSEKFCSNGRWKRLQIALFTKSNLTIIEDVCWNLMSEIFQNETFQSQNEDVIARIVHSCPRIFLFPLHPIALGHIRLVYFLSKEHFNRSYSFIIPTLVCYNDRFCPNFSLIYSLLLFEQQPIFDENHTRLSCHYFHHLPLEQFSAIVHWKDLQIILENFFRSSCRRHFHDPINCSSYSQLYQCLNSLKCISKHRLHDGRRDCPHGDDENYPNSCSLLTSNSHFQCQGFNICISSLLFQHRQYQCLTHINQSKFEQLNEKVAGHLPISFSTLCDGFEERLPWFNETDETHCDEHIWPCRNLYTRCDGYWNCANGYDELACPSRTDRDVCQSMEHRCVSVEDFQIRCMNLSKMNDGKIDCLGGFDERSWCRRKHQDEDQLGRRFLCSTSEISKNIDDHNAITCLDVFNICDRSNNCPNNEDEQICSNIDFFCDSNVDQTSYQEILCRLDEVDKPIRIPFRLTDHSSLPPPRTLSSQSKSLVHLSRDPPGQYHRRCNRGIPIETSTNISCLCSESYHGSHCQYQTDRISLTLQFQVQQQWRSIFQIFIRLIDQDYQIHSYEQINYLPIRDCQAKYTFYLLYRTRFKDSTKNYSLQFDVYLAENFQYRASWFYPIKHRFLPVHRLAYRLTIPLNSSTKPCSLVCHGHGTCQHYENTGEEFCHCHSNWTGRYCQTTYSCQCSFDARCMGSPLTCLCPWTKFGRRCYLHETICEQNASICLNQGTCVPKDRRFSSSKEDFQCICSEDYSGSHCQYRNARLDIHFSSKLIEYFQLLAIHLITANGRDEHRRTTMLARVNFEQTMVRFYTSIEFHLIFAQIKEKFYSIYLSSEHHSQGNYSLEIRSSKRCLHIDQIFNTTIIDYTPLRRVKSYHLACREHLDLQCFYDFETFLCLCTHEHHANCFNFDFQMKNDCEGKNPCLNHGQCYQDLPHCPSKSVCLCEECFYGSRCQFSTKTYGLSLDPILGYHIRANVSFVNQSNIVKTSLGLVMIIFLLGILGASFSIMTFRREKTRQIGCGIYLLVSSIFCLMIFIGFLLKYLFLLFIQSELLKQVWILKSNCLLMDYFLRTTLQIHDWLNACVAIERIFVVIKGVQFDKNKSRKMSKWLIISVIILVMLTGLHDPIHREIVFDEDEHRTWCVVRYPSNSFVHYYDTMSILFHFILPFFINFFASLAIIFLTARMRSALRDENFLVHFRQQWNEHKHLILSSCLLVILALPRLIISLSGGCMNSARNPWLFLFGYFISFLPTMLFFVVFVLTSNVYKQDFKDAIKSLSCKRR